MVIHSLLTGRNVPCHFPKTAVHVLRNARLFTEIMKELKKGTINLLNALMILESKAQVWKISQHAIKERSAHIENIS